MNLPYGLPCVDDCLKCELRSEKFFCSLSRESLEAFNRVKHPTIFPEDAVIFLEGQAPRGVFMLCQGRAKLSTSSRNGKTFILHIAQPGEVMGLQAVVTDKPYEVTVETMQPCQLDFVIRDDFIRFLEEHGDASLRAAQQISREYRDAFDVIRTIGLSRSMSSRIARFLLESALDGKETNGEIHSRLPLSHEEISQLIGTSRETITRTLASFRQKNIAELKGSALTIHNRLALQRIVTD